MRLFGLIGYPLGHSFSKKYFTEKFEKESISDCKYELFPITDISQLDHLIQTQPDLVGLNVTIPYKQSVLSYLSSTENLPAGLDACNCIRIEKGKLTGYNTDVVGFEKSFLENIQLHHDNALVLGNGGSSAAVAYVLKKNKIHFQVVSRKLHTGSHLTYSDLSPEIMKKFKVIVNTTPLGTYPKTEECPDIPYECITNEHYLFDLVYNPAKTLFLQKGEERGATIKNGYDMLVYQAEEGWRIWNEG